MARALCRSSRHVYWFLLLPLLLAVAPFTARAQELQRGGYDLRLFRHAVDSKGLASVNGTDILGHKS